MKKGKKMLSLLVMAGIISGSALLTTSNDVLIVQAAQEDLASGVIQDENRNITWNIDAQGHLTVSGTGDLGYKNKTDRAPWYDYRHDIYSASIDVKEMTDASYLFYDCSVLEEIDFSLFDTSLITNMQGMFEQCVSLEKLDLSSFDTREVTSMHAMFSCCENIKELDLTSFNTSKVVDMRRVFWMCKSLEQVDLSSFDTSNVTNLHGIFYECRSLKSVDICHFNTSKVQNMTNMFQHCKSIESLDLSKLDISNVTDLDFMISDCDNLKKIDISSFRDLSKLKYMTAFLEHCFMLEEIVVPINFSKCITLLSDKENKWVTPEGEIVDHIPMNLEESIVIRKKHLSLTEIFWDVHEDWYTEYVEYAYKNDLMNGIGATREFRPNGNITKAQVAQVLYNTLPEEPPFGTFIFEYKVLEDVYQKEWYAKAVSWAYSGNIVTGDLNTKCFYPNADVTREELALMLYRYAEFKEYNVSQSSDLSGLENAENVSDWAKTAMCWAVGSGLIQGVDKEGMKDLAPQETATRAQMAAILQRFDNMYK